MTTTVLTAALSLSVLLSCTGLDGVNADLKDLDSRVLALENAVTEINDNAVAVRKLMDASTVIVSRETSEAGVVLTLNDGSVVKVTYGKDIPGIVPMLGFSKKGVWMMSTDGGQTFSEIKACVNSNAGAGVTPKVKIDADGYWTISYDGGKTYTKILSTSGLPISATDGTEVAGKYAFFTSVSYNQDEDLMSFTLATGESFDVPVVDDFGIVTSDFDSDGYICVGESASFSVKPVGVENAVWKEVPQGWGAKLTDSELVFTAPDDAVEGKYSFTLIIFNKEGLAKTLKYSLTCRNIVLFDDFDASSIDTKLWEPCPRKYTTGWSMYMSESFDNAYVEDGKLILKAWKDPDNGYMSAGIQSKVNFGKCRIEVNAKFAKLAHGVVNAAWLFPTTTVWPAGGEIDIYEHLNANPEVWMTCHSYYTVTLGNDADAKHKKVSIDITQFNTYAIDLTEDAVIFYLNGTEVFRYANAKLEDEAVQKQYPFYTNNFYLLLDTCLGMEWPGEIKDSELPATTEIDWIKITKL